ncbi:hypothetical protein SpAn4DRAFT_0237 [Sporomusa ovata]|uniref:Uncharacterized protein n=1 Tax=Sporomusa ovata TaxID=2378 RepID=A0A0U1L2N1_9FIRM|nr:hypothetical protein SpAn4DRAFT_0237 [Sporomusa ovata]
MRKAKTDSSKYTFTTSEGWITMGEVMAGERLFDENSEVCQVVAGTKDLYC